MNKIIQRILREVDDPELINKLAKTLSPTDMQSLLLKVYQHRASEMSPKDILAQYRNNRFVQPAHWSAQDGLAFDQFAFSLLPNDVDVLELSPLSPLGSVSALTPVDQNNVVSTSRNTEVNSDATNLLALESALRRRDCLKSKSTLRNRVKLCASQRVVRSQTFDAAGAFAHFRLLGRANAGKDEGSKRFEIDALIEHIGYYVRLLKLSSQLDIQIKQLRLVLFEINSHTFKFISESVQEPILEAYPDVKIQADKIEAGHSYYNDIRFNIYASNKQDEEFMLVDGGFTNWTQQLLSSPKERLLTSGIGTERLVVCFGE